MRAVLRLLLPIAFLATLVCAPQALAANAANPRAWSSATATTTPLPGEDFSNPIPIASIPFQVQGNTCGYRSDVGDELCLGPGPDVFYVCTPERETWVSMKGCSDEMVVVTRVYMDSPPRLVQCVEDCDPGYAQLPTFAFFPGHTYYIVVDGYSHIDYSAACGAYVVTFTEITPPPRRCLTCPADAILENEAAAICSGGLQDHQNSGCDGNRDELTPAVFQDVAVGATPVTVCGLSGSTSYYHDYRRDNDWFRLSLAEPSRVVATLDSEVPAILCLVRVNDLSTSYCVGVDTLSFAGPIPPCSPTEAVANVAAGTYYVKVGPWYSHYVPCDWKYLLTLRATDPATRTKRATWTSVKAIYR